MELRFLDTNVFIRFITRDDPEQAQRVRKLFQQVEADTLQVTTSGEVLMEVVYVLSSKKLYALPRDQIQRAVSAPISLRGLKLANKRDYLEALDLFVDNRGLSFVDSLIVTQARRAGARIVSFDKGFDRIAGVTREEP